MFQIRGYSKQYERVQVMRDELWFLGVTEVNRNVGHDGFSPEIRFCYLQKGLLSPLTCREASREVWRGEKEDLRVGHKNAKQERFRFTQKCLIT